MNVVEPYRVRERMWKVWDVEARDVEGYFVIGTMTYVFGYRGFLHETLGLGRVFVGPFDTERECAFALLSAFASQRRKGIGSGR